MLNLHSNVKITATSYFHFYHEVLNASLSGAWMEVPLAWAYFDLYQTYPSGGAVFVVYMIFWWFFDGFSWKSWNLSIIFGFNVFLLAQVWVCKSTQPLCYSTCFKPKLKHSQNLISSGGQWWHNRLKFDILKVVA